MNQTPTTHCQICGRPILANTGRIAHHGYKRPQGWHSQTSSCFGAKFVPYETDHDALDEYIPYIESWLVKAKAEYASWLAEPPETIVYQRRDAYGRTGQAVTYTRPANFDAKRHAEAGSYSPHTYEGQFTRRAHDLRDNVRGLTAELAFLRDRRAAWRAR
jgi:hypothetical protein